MKTTNIKTLTKPTNDAQQKIIAAALELFAVNGYSATSVDSIATKAKISKGLIYYYFRSKEDILKGVFGYLLTKTGMLYEGTGNRTPQQFLKKLVDDSFRLIVRQKKLYRLILALTIQPEVVKGLRVELESVRKLWMEGLVQVFAALGYAQPETEAYLLVALFDGIGLAYLSMPDYPIHEIQQVLENKYNL